MALIILEGLDRVGKSTVAEQYKAKGFELIHQGTPPKGQTSGLFVEEQVQLISSAAGKDVVLDRSYYGELVWPKVYGRPSLLDEEKLEALREIEKTVGTTRILMHDPSAEKHWKRCVENNEPMTKLQFVQARKLFLELAEKYGFEKKNLLDYKILAVKTEVDPQTKEQDTTYVHTAEMLAKSKSDTKALSKEQVKLETANAISDVLSRRILKPKGQIYDRLEISLRTYLNGELAKIFGNVVPDALGQFTTEEVELLKFFCGRLKEGKK